MFYEKTVLPSGITVITEKVPGVRSITMGYWFQVGARDERPDQAGMSHFMEHMMFKGTPTRDAMQISAAFEGLGAELNAFTAQEYTCYYARFVDEKLDSAMDYMSDMVCHSLFDKDCCESEREVVIEEIARSEDTPDDHIWSIFTDALMPTHPLGRNVLGTRDIVGGFGHEASLEYHDSHYLTGNLTIVLSGNVEHSQAVELASRHLCDLKQGDRQSRPSAQETQQQDHIYLQKRDSEQCHVIYGTLAYAAGNPDRYAAAILNCALGGGMSSRLFQEIREKRGLAYAVFSQMESHTDAGEFAIYAGTRPSNVEQVVELMENIIADVARDGITDEEMSRARDFITGQILLGMESTRARMMRIGRVSVMNQPLESIEDLLDAYRSVTLDDIGRVAADILTRKPTLAIIGPQGVDEFEKMFR